MTILSNQDESYMLIALKEAQKALDANEVPIGAVIVSNGRIIARAHNLTERLMDVTAHAEMQAITSAAAFLGSKYLEGCTLYVTVEPCQMCAGALFWTQISRVVYGAPDNKRGFTRIGSRMLHPSTLLHGGLMQEECAVLMKQFFKTKR